MATKAASLNRPIDAAWSLGGSRLAGNRAFLVKSQRCRGIRESRSEGFGPVSEAEAGTEGAKGTVAGDKGETGGEGMSGHEHVHGGEGAAPFPRGGA